MPFGLDVSDDRPVLHLSGPRLTQSLETLVERSEDHGGVESYITGLRFKASVISEAVSRDRLPSLGEKDLLGICAFMASVRRRIGPWLAQAGVERASELIAGLLENATDTGTADSRMEIFCAAFPDDKSYRWARDLAAEILHSAYPEHYPLMNRWIWDRVANSGVLREIWHGEDTDRKTLDIPDGYQTYLVLREELSQFLADNGVYRDMLFYVDLLCAQIYADYINEQGGTFLRTDFSSEQDPMQYTRRMLGLDGIDADTGRTRAIGADGKPVVLDASEIRH